MESNQLIIDAFGRIRDAVHETLDGLNPDQLAFRPGKTANSIAWLIWHLTRVQDDHISDLRQTPQTWTAQGWHGRFDLPFSSSETGYGHTSDQVASVKASGDLLTGYHDAVSTQTIEYVAQLASKDYEKIVDTAWDPPVTLAVRLISVISDDLQHVGQAAYVRGLLRPQPS